ncbi:MAG: hypothetical protein JWN66_2287 [Sphingomonas bacterium]|uniref:hypothetical protein n=1 Tax=Sphingomonas bacterium TaxID=1895847 RepID=UPI0026373B41|nr:hypothetical protein [Sphingomonas bacterium]MDB5705171.1 hypothetical protein [Sphingomonas bacterium]
MSAPLAEWKVLPHGRLTEAAPNILTVTGTIHMPIGDFPRRMTIVRLQDGRLVIYNAIALDEAQMREIEAFGDPAFLIVPNDHHRLDAGIWKERYPALHVVTPPAAREKVEETVAVDTTSGDFGDPNVTWIVVPGTRSGEAALQVDGLTGTTLILNDIVGNIRGTHGFGGWLLRMMGFAGDEPHVPAPVKRMMVGHKADLAAQLRAWAALPNLKRIIVSHGETIEDDPAGTLTALAKALE